MTDKRYRFFIVGTPRGGFGCRHVHQFTAGQSRLLPVGDAPSAQGIRRECPDPTCPITTPRGGSLSNFGLLSFAVAGGNLRHSLALFFVTLMQIFHAFKGAAR